MKTFKISNDPDYFDVESFEIKQKGVDYTFHFGSTQVGEVKATPQSYNSKIVHISNLEIYDSFRNGGFATTFLELLITNFVELGVRELICYVKTNNLPSLKLFWKLGFSLENLGGPLTVNSIGFFKLKKMLL